jgi:hypothetical protein
MNIVFFSLFLLSIFLFCQVPVDWWSSSSTRGMSQICLEVRQESLNRIFWTILLLFLFSLGTQCLLNMTTSDFFFPGQNMPIFAQSFPKQPKFVHYPLDFFESAWCKNLTQQKDTECELVNCELTISWQSHLVNEHSYKMWDPMNSFELYF